LDLCQDQVAQLRELFEKQKQKRSGSKIYDPSSVDEFSAGLESILTDNQRVEFKKYKETEITKGAKTFASALVNSIGGYREVLSLSAEQKTAVEAALVKWHYSQQLAGEKATRLEAISPFLTKEQIEKFTSLYGPKK